MQRIRKNDGQRNSVARGSSVIGASQRAVAIFSSSEPSRGTVKVQNANKTGFSAVSHPSNHSPSTGATIYTHNQRSSLTDKEEYKYSTGFQNIYETDVYEKNEGHFPPDACM